MDALDRYLEKGGTATAEPKGDSLDRFLAKEPEGSHEELDRIGEPAAKPSRFHIMAPSPIGLPIPFGHFDLDLQDQNIKDSINYSEQLDIPLGVAYRSLPRLRKITEKIEKAKKYQGGMGLGPIIDEGTSAMFYENKTMREILGLPQKKVTTIHLDRIAMSVPKGLMRFIERDVGGNWGGTVYDWLGQFIEQGGYAVDQFTKLGAKDPDRVYNPYAESIIAMGQGLSLKAKEARRQAIWHATHGWEAVDENLKETDPVSYYAEQISEGLASSALSVLAMYLSGGATAGMSLADKGMKINKGLVLLSSLSFAGSFQHAQEQKENFYWSTLHGLTDGIIEYVMESTFLEGIGPSTKAWKTGAKEGLEEMVTGGLQNTRAGTLENLNKGMDLYHAIKSAAFTSFKQMPIEGAAGFIGGWGIHKGANLTSIVNNWKKTSVVEPIAPTEPPVKATTSPVKPTKPEISPVAPKEEVSPVTEGEVAAEGKVEKQPWEMTKEEYNKSVEYKSSEKETEIDKLNKQKRSDFIDEYRNYLNKTKPEYGGMAARNIMSKPLWQLHEELVKYAVESGKSVPRNVIKEYSYRPWAKEALAKAPVPAAGKPKTKPREGGFLTMPETPSPEVLREGAEKLYQGAVNRFASIENITKKAKALGMEIEPGEDPGLKARTYLGIGRKVETILKDKTFRTTKQGNTEITGEGFKPILDDFDKTINTFEVKRETREKEFTDYLIAQRTILDLQRPAYEGAKANIASEKQVSEAEARIEELHKKYGDVGVAKFEEIANRLYDYQKRILHLLVDGGNLSQKQYDNIVAKNPHYIPFDRVLEAEAGGIPTSKKRFTEARAPVTKIKGSELEIQNPFESIIKNTYRIVEAAERNTVARSIAKIGKVLPDEISPVRIKMYPIRIDPKEILTVSRTFKSRSSEVLEEAKEITSKGGSISGPMAKLETVVKEALQHRGFSEAESNSFISQIRKGEDIGDVTTETIKQIVKETQRIIISEEPVESTIFRPSQFKPKGNVIEYYDNGKRKYIEVTPNLYRAMTGLNETSASLAIRILSKPAHWLRVGATITPEFIVRNPIRDQYTAYMQTSFGFIPFVDSIGAIADVLGRTDAYHDWLRSGGAYSGFVELNRPALKKAYKQLTNRSTMNKIVSKLNIIADAEDLSQLMEQATRLGVFKKAKKSGLSDIEAGFESREATTDFARRGAAMADVNRVIAFFNASIQGFDKSIRNAIKNPFSTAMKGALAITLPSLLLYLRNRNDPEYKEIPRWQKDLFWIVRIGGIHFRVPKPFLYGQVFGSLPERFFEYLDTKDPESFKGLAKSLYESVSPVSGTPESGLLPTAIKPIIENSVNWNFFMERPIVSESRQDLIPSEQYGRYTSETAKQLGEWFNYSPAKIENLTRGYFGGTGRYALEGSDMLVNGVKKAAGIKVEPKRPKELADIPLVKGFVVRPTGASAQSIQDFYDESEDIINLSNTYNKMKREGKKEEALKLREKNPQIRIASILRDYRSDLSDIQKKIDKIIKSDISDSQKREKIKLLDEKRVEKAVKGRLKIKSSK